MNSKTRLTIEQLTGCCETHLVSFGSSGHRLQEEAADAFERLRQDASQAGFELAIASSFRSFERQLAIWNGKASGVRAVHDDLGHDIVLAHLPPMEQLHAILRFSALPGTSRHHWGTDLDIYDAAAIPSTYDVQLTPQEVAPGGVFDRLHCWLDQKIAEGESHGFYRPYARDRGGVAPERWHLSYAPVAAACAGDLTVSAMRSCWDRGEERLLLRSVLDETLPEIVQRYISVDSNWCPAEYV